MDAPQTQRAAEQQVYRIQDGVEIPISIDGFSNFGHIPLETMHNARDLGGLPTRDGRRVKANKLIRSGELHHISAADAINVLGEHDVRCVVDLRTKTEFDHAPDDPIVYECADYRHLPVFGASAIGITHAQGFVGNMRAALAAATDLKSTVENSYDDAILGEMGIEAYRLLLNIIVDHGDRDGAVLWHCSAGKDRTGIGAILIEHILGVSKDDILRDYLATNIFSLRRNRTLPYSLAPVLRDLTGIDMSSMFYVYKEYFDFVMQRIESLYGGLDGYIREALGISQDMQEYIKASYLH